jgi:hypothetical protein
MRISTSGLRALLAILLAMAFASAANAGHWQVIYDLAPGSTLTTNAPGGPFTDPITGKLTIEYDAASSGAPLAGARLVAGQIDNTLNQPAGVLTVTGSNMNALSPGTGGTPGTLSGAVLNLAVVANHTLAGFLHCYDGTGAGGFCDIFFGTPSSTPIPQTGSGTFALPNFNFAATAGVGDFTSDPVVSTPQSGVTTTVVYVGKEISRIWKPSAAVPTLGPAGIGILLGGIVACGGLLARRRH